MRNVVVFGGHDTSPLRYVAPHLQRVTVDGHTMRCGIVHTPDAHFEPDAEPHRHSALVRVRALSCNHRDRGLLYRMRLLPAQRFFAIGSEFVATVVAVGAEVTSLTPGDRVIPNHHYVGGGMDDDGARQGVCTNSASKELLILPASKLKRVPDAMPDEAAAAFSLNAQTAYSMVRRVAPEAGSTVLVTAAGSNTSLAVIGALAARHVTVVATSSSAHAIPALVARGAAHVVYLPRRTDTTDTRDPLREFSEQHGLFDAVIDPFFDLHLARVLWLIRPAGTYITCGLAAQNPNAAVAAGITGPTALEDVLYPAMLRNLTLIANCIGLSSDLDAAIADFVAGSPPPVIDSVFSGETASAFLDRTFNARDRFGKVVYRYVD